MESKDGKLPEISTILADRYRIDRQIGQGGMATVYLAEDLKLGRQVALKVLRPELGAVLGTERFLAEIKITARLDHPHILTLIDSGWLNGMLYYVLPFVRGESLRDLLNRDSQLGVEQALAITRQIGSALDYAHRHGIVHRDVKPENVLLHENVAMLADFGIALAVQESGGSRLTETGLSLGTPHYMSPEQATGDRNLDARSDQYSLAAVLYEMLVGEPPLTGRSVQAIVAKLLTEVPMRVHVVRPTVPAHVDDAIARGLSKVRADRFGSVSEFLGALEGNADAKERGRTTPLTSGARSGARRWGLITMMSGIVLVGAVALAMMTKQSRLTEAPATVRDRTQLTFTGRASAPTISLDGKQLAYFTKECVAADCRYAIDVQDVGSTTTRRLLEGATAAYTLDWSPDRRNLIMHGTIGARTGAHIIPVLGGPPRFLSMSAATFYAGGDSVLLGPSEPFDASFTLRIAGLDGTVRDSVRVSGKGDGLSGLIAIPGTSHFVVGVARPPVGLWQLVDRTGRVTDSMKSPCLCGAVASSDALWMMRNGPTTAEAVVRVALDPENGRFGAKQDTVYRGQFTNLSVTADGTQMVVDEGSHSYSAAVAGLDELIKGTLPANSTRLEASRRVDAIVSPDAKRLLLLRTVPSPDGPERRDVRRYSITPFDGGSETPVSTEGRILGADWADSVTVFFITLVNNKLGFSRTDIRTGKVSQALTIEDSTASGMAPLPDGWAWIPPVPDRIVIDRRGKRHEIAKPSWSDEVIEVDGSVDGSRLLLLSGKWTASENVGLDVVPTSGGKPVRWWRGFAENVWAGWLTDGSIALAVWSSSDAVTIHKLTGPGRAINLGTIKHVAGGFNVSKDLRRAVITWREYRGDAWRYTVVKPQAR